MNISDATAPTSPLFTSTAANIYGFAANKGRIFVADATNYTTNGKAFVYDSAGSLNRTIDVGLIPNGFYFN